MTYQGPPLRRSMMYVPGHRPDLIDQARRSAADVVCLDLEDNVPPDEKPRARELLARILKEGGFRALELIIRINDPGSAAQRADLEMLRDAAFDGLLIPKVTSPEDGAAVARALATRETKLWCMIESGAAILNCHAIAKDAPRISALVIGATDLSNNLRLREQELSRGLDIHTAPVVATARAYGLSAIQGITLDAAAGNPCGFDGRSTFIGLDVAAVNAAFSPTASEIAHAKEQIERPLAYGDHKVAAQGLLEFAARAAERDRALAATAQK